MVWGHSQGWRAAPGVWARTCLLGIGPEFLSHKALARCGVLLFWVLLPSWFGGHTWRCSGVIPESPLRDHFWWGSEELYGGHGMKARLVTYKASVLSVCLQTHPLEECESFSGYPIDTGIAGIAEMGFVVSTGFFYASSFFFPPILPPSSLLSPLFQSFLFASTFLPAQASGI